MKGKETVHSRQPIRVRYVSRLLFLCTALVGLWLPSGAVKATYNANLTGVPVHVSTYDNGSILIKLDNQLTSHPMCDAGFFSIDKTLDPVLINRMLARALAAHAAQQPLLIGYDNTGSCVNGYVRVHRVG